MSQGANADITDILNRASTALQDWMIIYGDDYSHEDEFVEAKMRINAAGETLKYTAAIRRDIKTLLETLPTTSGDTKELT